MDRRSRVRKTEMHSARSKSPRATRGEPCHTQGGRSGFFAAALEQQAFCTVSVSILESMKRAAATPRTGFRPRNCMQQRVRHPRHRRMAAARGCSTFDRRIRRVRCHPPTILQARDARQSPTAPSRSAPLGGLCPDASTNSPLRGFRWDCHCATRPRLDGTWARGAGPESPAREVRAVRRWPARALFSRAQRSNHDGARRSSDVFVILDAEVLKPGVVLLTDAENGEFVLGPVVDVCCVASIVQ